MRTYSHTTGEGHPLAIVVDFIVEKKVIQDGKEVITRKLIARNENASCWASVGETQFICGQYYLVDTVIGYNEENKYEVVLTQPESK